MGAYKDIVPFLACNHKDLRKEKQEKSEGTTYFNCIIHLIHVKYVITFIFNSKNTTGRIQWYL